MPLEKVWWRRAGKGVNMKKKRKIWKVILSILAILILIVIVAAVLLWNQYLNKYNLLKQYETSKSQEVYILGTLHQDHFNEIFDYSIEDILSVAENLNPDAIFIEAREKYFVENDVVDGPVEMSVVYAYCLENNIDVKMIDYWELSNDMVLNSTSEDRDNHIFQNIDTELSKLSDGQRVLIICGSGHLGPQTKRFKSNGYQKQKIEGVRDLFESNHEFSYPKQAAKEWDKRSYFYAYTFPEIVEHTEGLSDEAKSKFVGGNAEAFYQQQKKYCDMFNRNQLYQ